MHLNKLITSLKKEIYGNAGVYATLTAILVFGFYLRVYRIGQVLGFYFDQGRDANVIWNLLNNGKFFLIGPTTGIAGIFRGPFYYYLIAPFYALGGGDPIWPSIFLSFTTMFAVLIAYYLAKEAAGRTAGLLVAVVASFSFNIVIASRWLSNPTPMFILSMLLILFMHLIAKSKKGQAWAWTGLAIVAGSSLFHFGSAGEFFYLPALAIFALWQRKKITRMSLVAATLAFAATAAPQVIFDIRHEGILRNNVATFLFSEGSFKLSFAEVLEARFSFYYDVFFTKVFHSIGEQERVLLSIFSLSFIFFVPRLLKKDINKIISLLLVSPMIGLLFFQGNEGNIYDYYLTGYYLIFLLLFAIVLGLLSKSLVGKVLVAIFIILFLQNNYPITISRISDGVDGPHTIAFGNQKQALDWIYEDAKGEEFNIDVYVPPVIPHAYEYLFKWYGKDRVGPVDQHLDLLYTLYEVDPPHPERLDEWMERQKGIGVVEYEESFGGITVQRRSRI